MHDISFIACMLQITFATSLHTIFLSLPLVEICLIYLNPLIGKLNPSTTLLPGVRLFNYLLWKYITFTFFFAMV